MPSDPWFKFYFKDWRANPKLRAASRTERDIWLDCMCLFADSSEFGLLRWDLRRLALALPCHLNALHSLVQQGILKGAPSGQQSEAVVYVDSEGRSHTVLDRQPGPIWFSTRMLIDHWKRNRDRRNGRKGGSPLLSPDEKRKKKKQKGLTPGGNPSLPSHSLSDSSEEGGPGEGTNGHRTHTDILALAAKVKSQTRRKE